MRGDRNYFWALKAAGREIVEMRAITDSKVGKPGSPYSVSILKICSILKGAGRDLDPAQTFGVMREATSHLHVSEREAMRMWGRAMRTARPRFPAANE